MDGFTWCDGPAAGCLPRPLMWAAPAADPPQLRSLLAIAPGETISLICRFFLLSTTYVMIPPVNYKLTTNLGDSCLLSKMLLYNILISTLLTNTVCWAEWSCVIVFPNCCNNANTWIASLAINFEEVFVLTFWHSVFEKGKYLA